MTAAILLGTLIVELFILQIKYRVDPGPEQWSDGAVRRSIERALRESTRWNRAKAARLPRRHS